MSGSRTDYDGFVRQPHRSKRSFSAAFSVDDPERSLHMSLENPAGGMLWHVRQVRCLLESICNSKQTTSYCKYTTRFRKDTTIATTLRTLELHPPCCTALPCRDVRERGVHSQEVQGSSMSEKCAIPYGICSAVMLAFVAETPSAKYRIVVDAFAGTRSFHRTREQDSRLRGSLYVYDNDIVERGQRNTLDMSTRTSNALELLLRFALLAHLPHEVARRALSDSRGLQAGFTAEGVAVLLHLSPPCTTYSVAGIAKHRRMDASTGKRTTAVTEAATEADAMNTAMLAWCVRCITSAVQP